MSIGIYGFKFFNPEDFISLLWPVNRTKSVSDSDWGVDPKNNERKRAGVPGTSERRRRAHAAPELVWRHCSLDAAESDLH